MPCCHVHSWLLNREMFKWSLGRTGLCLGFPKQRVGTACLGHVVCTVISLMGFEDLERIFLICGGMCSALFRKVIKARVTKVPLQNSTGQLFLRSGIL